MTIGTLEFLRLSFSVKTHTIYRDVWTIHVICLVRHVARHRSCTSILVACKRAISNVPVLRVWADHHHPEANCLRFPFLSYILGFLGSATPTESFFRSWSIRILSSKLHEHSKIEPGALQGQGTAFYLNPWENLVIYKKTFQGVIDTKNQTDQISTEFW